MTTSTLQPYPLDNATFAALKPLKLHVITVHPSLCPCPVSQACEGLILPACFTMLRAPTISLYKTIVETCIFSPAVGQAELTSNSRRKNSVSVCHPSKPTGLSGAVPHEERALFAPMQCCHEHRHSPAPSVCHHILCTACCLDPSPRALLAEWRS